MVKISINTRKPERGKKKRIIVLELALLTLNVVHVALRQLSCWSLISSHVVMVRGETQWGCRGQLGHALCSGRF